jgi:hypothetical protein
MYSSPLPPLPRLVDPARSQIPPPECPLPNLPDLSQMSTIADTDKPVTMARRVRLEGLSSRSPLRLPLSFADASSSTHSTGLANIGRLGWPKSVDSHSRRNSRAHTYSRRYRARTQKTTSRGRSFGPPSASSGGSVYHDARSSLPGTLLYGAASLAPLPRALTPSGPTTPECGWSKSAGFVRPS